MQVSPTVTSKQKEGKQGGTTNEDLSKMISNTYKRLADIRNNTSKDREGGSKS